MLPLLIILCLTFPPQDTASVHPVTLLKNAKKYALEEKVIEATESLYEGLEIIGNHSYIDTLFNEVWDILSATEFKAFKKSNDKGRFLLRFWHKQDPTPATLENQRYVEHIRRLEHARRHYASVQPRGYDDRGMIYVSYGRPDNSVVITSSNALHPNESWVYHIRGTQVAFDFVSKGGLFFLVLDLREFIPGKRYFFARGTRDAYRQILEPRLNLSLKYFKLYNKYVSGGVGLSFSNYIAQTMEDHNRTPNTISYFTKPERPLPCAITLCRFFRNERSRVEIYYAVPWKELDVEQYYRGNKADITINYTIRDMDYNLITQNTDNSLIYLSNNLSPKNQIHINQFNEHLEPGEYLYSIEIKNMDSNKATEKAFQLEIPELSSKLLLSDLQLASDIQPRKSCSYDSPFVKNDLYIIPYPFSTVSRLKPIYIYFEVNNLLFNEASQSAYTVEYKLTGEKTGLAKLNPFARKKLALSSSYQRNGNKRNEQEYFSLNMEKLKPGEYALSIELTDDIARTNRKSEITIHVVD